MVSTAFKPQADWFSTPPDLLPLHPTIDNFVRLSSGNFPRFFLNSGIVALLTTVPTLIIAVLAAYAISFLRFRGQGLLVPVILLTQLLPTAVTVIPLYRTASQLGALDSLISLAVAYMSFSTPVAVWLLRGFMSHLPIELQEAAEVDGCTKLQAFRHALLPIAVPGIVAAGVYVFFNSWQEFILALTFLSTKTNATLPVGILGFIGEHSTDWGQLMAACLVLTIPLFAIFAYLQRFLVAGLSQGAVKG
jgi:ABC-type glycerol-3-phosphate transport system permease component